MAPYDFEHKLGELLHACEVCRGRKVAADVRPKMAERIARDRIVDVMLCSMLVLVQVS